MRRSSPSTLTGKIRHVWRMHSGKNTASASAPEPDVHVNESRNDFVALMHRALGTVGQGVVRFSFSHFNTEEEIERAAEAVRALAEEA